MSPFYIAQDGTTTGAGLPSKAWCGDKWALHGFELPSLFGMELHPVPHDIASAPNY